MGLTNDSTCRIKNVHTDVNAQKLYCTHWWSYLQTRGPFWSADCTITQSNGCFSTISSYFILQIWSQAGGIATTTSFYQQTISTRRSNVHVREIVEPTSKYVNSLKLNSRVLSISRNCESLPSWHIDSNKDSSAFGVNESTLEPPERWSASSSIYPWLHELQRTITQKGHRQPNIEPVKKL